MAELPNGRELRLWSRGDEEIANIVFWHGWDGYEPQTSGLLFRLAAKAEVTIDIGAHIGFYSVVAALANPAATVFALEPHPEVFARLERTLRINEAGNVRAFRLAAGSEAGNGELLEPVSSALTTMSTLSHEFALHADRFGARPHRYGMRSFEVAVQPLDDFVAEQGIDRVDLLKIDTETTEDDVLRGAEATLARDRPQIFCEVLNPQKGSAIEDLLKPLGYRFLRLDEGGPQPQARIVVEEGKNDYLFTTAPDLVPR